MQFSRFSFGHFGTERGLLLLMLGQSLFVFVQFFPRRVIDREVRLRTFVFVGHGGNRSDPAALTESFSSLSFHLDSALLADSGFTTGSSTVLDATFPSFQDRKEKVSFAMPKPASSGTRTGPWKRHPQQNL